jgi:ribosomal protein S18 acetylase RimI-like enzyme
MRAGAMMNDLERAATFEELIRDRCTERVVETRFGPALFNDTHSTIWNLNVVRAERPGEAGAEVLAAEVERVQEGLGHRRVILPPGATALENGFRQLGWQPDHFLFMAYRGDGEPADTARVEEVEPEQLRPLREAIICEWQQDADETTVSEILAADMLMWKAANSRIFGIVEDGRVVSSAQLYSDGATAQVEEVATLPAYRGRGHAKTLVTRAVAEAVAGHHEFIFLVADGDDWPKKLYNRLGFEEVGSRFAFLRRG